MQIYGLKNCDKCRKAQKYYGLHTIIDIRDTPLSPELLQRAYDTFGDSLLNRASTTWRGLSEDTRSQDTLTLLRTYPALMKRPLIVHDDGTLTLGKIGSE